MAEGATASLTRECQRNASLEEIYARARACNVSAPAEVYWCDAQLDDEALAADVTHYLGQDYAMRVQEVVDDPRVAHRRRLAAILTEDVRRRICRAFIRGQRGLVRGQLDSADRLMLGYLDHIFHDRSTVLVDSPKDPAGPAPDDKRVLIEFGRVVVGKPAVLGANGILQEVTPPICRRDSLTYMCPVSVDVRTTVFDTSRLSLEDLQKRGRDCVGLPAVSHETREVLLCNIPCMTGSAMCSRTDSQYLGDECIYDPPGYFIINGSEKFVIAQQGKRNNIPSVSREKTGKPQEGYLKCEVRSLQSKFRCTSTMYVWFTHDLGTVGADSVEAVIAGGDTADCLVAIPYLDPAVPLPLVAVFRLLGLAKLADMEAVVMEHCAAADEADVRALVRGVLAATAAAVNTGVTGRDTDAYLQAAPGGGVGLKRKRGRRGQQNAAAVILLSQQQQGEARTGTDDAWLSYEAVSVWVARRAVQEKTHTATGKRLVPQGDLAERDRRRVERLEGIIATELLPHVSLDRDPPSLAKKAAYLGMCVHKMCLIALKKCKLDDPDAHQAVADTGRLMGLKIRSAFTKDVVRPMASKIRSDLEKRRPLTPVMQLIKEKAITLAIQKALKSGCWGGGGKGGGKAKGMTGVAQLHARLSYMAALSNLRRVAAHKHKEGKNSEPLQLRMVDFRRLCGAETPDGDNCGVVKAWALLHHTRPDMCQLLLLHVLERMRTDQRPWAQCACPLSTQPDPTPAHVYDGLYGALPPEPAADACPCWRQPFVPFDLASPTLRRHGHCVMINSGPAGYTWRPGWLVSLFGAWRRNDAVPHWVTAAWIAGHADGANGVTSDTFRSRGAVHIQAEGGDSVAPVFRLAGVHHVPAAMERYERHGDDDLLIGDLLSTGAVEFVTSGDQGVAVAVLPTDLVWPREIKDLVLFGWDSYRNYTHIEIHPVAAAFGSSAALVPYGNCNQAPRVSYHTGMGKHATSLTFLTGRHRTDSSAQQLWEPQVPLVQTFCEEATGSSDLPSVTNLMVLVMCNPFGIEDPYILNRDSAQLGVGICTVTHTVRDEEKARNTDSSCFERPGDNCESRHHVDYGRINVMGFAPPGTVLQPGDPIIGKTIRTEQAGDRAGTAVRDASTYHKDHDSAVVDMVIDTVGRDGERAIKSRYHSVRMAAVGDKYATRHGQKGSVGHMVPATDMPFTASGLTADIIVNPHAYPSRMTPAMHREALAGLCALLDFSVEDATPFTQNEGRDMEILMERLRAHGYHPCAEETFYCGKTGEPLPGTYFYAPISFLKLKQRAADKKHTRSEGPVQVLSRQPVEGRMRDGGFRQGPMEVTCYNTHGAAAVINDRLCKSSDVFPIVVCHKCRLVGEPAHKQWRGPQDGPRTEEHLPYCRACKSHKHTEERPMSYGFKMLLQSMQSMNMCLYLELGPIQHGPPPLLEGMPRDMNVLVDGGVLEDEHGKRWTARNNNDATAALTPHVGGPTDTPKRMHNMDPPAPRPQKKRRIVVDDDDDSADNASVDITQVDSNQDVGLESMF